MWVGLGKFGEIWAKVGKDGQVWMGQIDLAGIGEISSEWVWVCLQVKGWVWESLNRYSQGWVKVGRSGWVRLIRQGWVTYLVCVCVCVCVPAGLGVGVGECRRVLTDMGNGGQLGRSG